MNGPAREFKPTVFERAILDTLKEYRADSTTSIKALADRLDGVDENLLAKGLLADTLRANLKALTTRSDNIVHHSAEHVSGATAHLPDLIQKAIC